MKIIAIDLKKDIDIQKIRKKFKNIIILDTKDVIIIKEKERYVSFFSFGSIIFFGFTNNNVLKFCSKNNIGEINKDAIEYYTVKEGKKDEVYNDKVILRSIDKMVVFIISIVLAQSVGLRYYENLINKKIEELNDIYWEISKKGKLKLKRKRFIEMVAETSMMLHEIMNELSLLEKPLIVWENERLEKLFEDLRYIFEIDVRFENILIKIEQMKSDLERLINIIGMKNTEKLEKIIIILILIEVILFIYEIFF